MGKALIIKGANFSSIAVDTIEITVGQPTISINILGQVTITSPNGEDIYYTTDGTTPTKNSTKYTGAFSVQSGTTVKAVCYYGGNYSDVSSQLYDGTLQAPTISITNKGVVTITATDNASIRYTVDGQTDPTSSSGTLYTEPFTVENGVVVKAIAYISDGGTTISSSVTTSEPAVVPESAAFGKAFVVSGAAPTGALKDDATRFVSPKIPVTGGASFTWQYTNATYGTDFVVCYNSSDAKVDYFNTGHATVVSSSITKTAPASTAYVRFSNLIGASYAGCKITQNGVTLWSYDGSTE